MVQKYVFFIEIYKRYANFSTKIDHLNILFLFNSLIFKYL